MTDEEVRQEGRTDREPACSVDLVARERGGIT